MPTAPKIVVIDYESGNLRSVAKALESVGVSPIVTADPAEIASADAVVFPGVGAAPSAMAALNSRNLVEPLRDLRGGGAPSITSEIPLRIPALTRSPLRSGSAVETRIASLFPHLERRCRFLRRTTMPIGHRWVPIQRPTLTIS